MLNLGCLKSIERVLVFPGRHLVDAIAPMQDQRFAIRQVLIAPTHSTRHLAQRMADFFQSHDVAVSILDDIADLSPASLDDYFSSLFANQPPASLLVNLSGLEPMWAICVHRAAARFDFPVFSVDPHTDQLHWLHTPSSGRWSSFNVMDRLSLSGLFRLNGYGVSQCKYSLRQRDEKLEWIASRLAELAVADSSCILAMNRLLANMSFGNPLLTSGIYTGKAARLDWLAKEGVFERLQTGQWLFRDAEMRAFLAGGWLELHVFAQVAALANEIGIQDAACSLKIASEHNVESEFDLAVMFNNQLYLAECKARGPANKSLSRGVGMDTLFKIDSLVEHRFLNARGMLISLNEPTVVEKNRAKLQDISLVSAGELRHLRSRLRDWLTQPPHAPA